MTLYDLKVETNAGELTTLGQWAGRALLIVNVASRCGLTPQFGALEALQRELGEAGLTVIGVPCNQFAGQEPGSAAEILDFCSTTYGVSFPLLAKTEVNGPGRDALYEALTQVPDAEGVAGDVQWNFEKFLVSPAGEPVARFRPGVVPDDPSLRAAIDAVLP